MARRIFAPIFLAGAAAAAIISAPVASANEVDCQDKGTASVCTRGGHASIYSEPRNDLHSFSIAPGPSWVRSSSQPPLLATE